MKITREIRPVKKTWAHVLLGFCPFCGQEIYVVQTVGGQNLRGDFDGTCKHYDCLMTDGRMIFKEERMYSITKVIYGMPFTKEMVGMVESKGFANQYEAENLEDVIVEYHGNAEFMPMWAGVQLDTFSEAEDPIFVDRLKLVPTDEQIREAQDNIRKLPQELSKMGPKIGVYFINTSS